MFMLVRYNIQMQYRQGWKYLNMKRGELFIHINIIMIHYLKHLDQCIWFIPILYWFWFIPILYWLYSYIILIDNWSSTICHQAKIFLPTMCIQCLHECLLCINLSQIVWCHMKESFVPPDIFRNKPTHSFHCLFSKQRPFLFYQPWQK